MPDNDPNSTDHPPDPAWGVKPHVMVVAHHVGDNLFGAERSLLDVLAAVDRRRFDLSCVLPSGNDAYLRAVAERTRDITVFSYQWWSKERPFDAEAVSRFESLFASKRVDLVHVNTMTLMDPLLAAKRLGLPGIVHARELFDQDRELMRRFGEDARAILNRIHAAADFVIANSDATHRLFYRRGASFRLYNGIDVDRFDLPNDLEPGRLKIGLISSNGVKKGIDSFVHLAHMAGLRRPELQFYAIGPRTEQTDRLAQEGRSWTGPSNLRFPGYVADPVEAIRLVNVVLSLTRVPESFGRTIAEAMAAGRPVIAYGWGGARELISHGHNGFLVPPLGLPEALAHLESLANHPDLVAEMGRNGRERAKQLFSSQIFAAELNGIYQRIMDIWKTRRGTRSESGPRGLASAAIADHVEDMQAVISVGGHRDKPAVGAGGHAMGKR
jgi:glycosyltransferase involved in cell wall biosynthesis